MGYPYFWKHLFMVHPDAIFFMNRFVNFFTIQWLFCASSGWAVCCRITATLQRRSAKGFFESCLSKGSHGSPPGCTCSTHLSLFQTTTALSSIVEIISSSWISVKPNLPPTIIGNGILWRLLFPDKNSANLPIFYSSTGWLWGWRKGHQTGVVLGYGSIYNHSAEPNLGYRRVRVDSSSEAVQGLSVPRWEWKKPFHKRVEKAIIRTVDGWNPAPLGMYKTW